MGRELKRVPLDFAHPVGKTWPGFLNDLPYGDECKTCGGNGGSNLAMFYAAQWYGNDQKANGEAVAAFIPENQNPPQRPHEPTDRPIWSFAERNVQRSPRFYVHARSEAQKMIAAREDETPLTEAELQLPEVQAAIRLEAERLCRMWNRQLSHHLTQDDVDALVRANRLMDFTHDWTKGVGWQKKEPAVRPTAEEVNAWSMSPGHFGHDSCNQWVVVKDRCRRRHERHTCAVCDGEGVIWPSPEAKAAYEAWESTEPPTGDGYQIWETVSEGSPISPVFATPEALARHMATTSWGADKGTPYETWLAFIRGPGWAPSFIMTGGVMQNGVDGVVEVQD